MPSSNLVPDAFFESAKKVVRKMVKVRPSELVLIVSDSNHKNVYEALCSAFEAVGVTPSVFLLPDCVRPISKFPQLLRDMLPRTNIVISVLDCSFEEQALQMALIQIAKKSGARVASLPNLTDEVFTGPLFDVNYAQVSERTLKLHNILKSVDVVEVTSEAGTDITLKPSEYLHDDTGFLFEPGKCGNLPGGLVSFEPVSSSVNGKVVVDGAISGKGLLGEPVEFDVVDGVVEEIPSGADFLKGLFEDDRAARRVCEFGLGTNHGAVLHDNVAVSDKALGTCHFALGNSSFFGGSLIAKYHVDLVLREPTVKFDGRSVIEAGKFLLA